MKFSSGLTALAALALFGGLPCITSAQDLVEPTSATTSRNAPTVEVMMATPSPIGHIDGISNATSPPQLLGWACSPRGNGPIDVHVYVGGPYGSGTLLLGSVANQPSEAGVAAACGTTWPAHRFVVPMTDAIRTAHGGKALFVYGISPMGAAPTLLAYSGHFVVPVLVNSAPTVTLTAPASGHSFTTGASLTLAATASDADDGVARVEFLVNGARIGEDASAPYTAAWTAATGTHTLAARVFDTRGAQALSATVGITVSTPPPPVPSQPAVSLTRHYVYDAYKRLCKIVEPETGATVIGYDAAGNETWRASGLDLPSTTDCDRESAWNSGRRVERTYDARGRVVTLRFPDGRGDQDWTYTADGLPATVWTSNDGPGAGRVYNAYTYNARRMLTGESLHEPGWTWSIGYGYDRNGHLVEQVNPDASRITYTVDALGQTTGISGSGTYVSGASYYPNGALKQFTYGNGIVHTLEQSLRGLPERSRDAHGSVAVHDDSYDFDANGNVVAITDGATGRNQRGNRTMAYDGLDRLTAVSSPMFTAARYEYDALDNLKRVTIGGAAGRDHYYCHDANNRLTNVKTGGCDSGASVIGLGYDVQGNLANKNGQQYAFDYGNRLREAVGKETYRYDAHGRRASAASASGSIRSFYNQGGQLVFQADGRAGKQVTHAYLAGSLVATREQSTATGVATLKFHHTDALGTPVVVTDATRNVIERSEYEPYGKLLNRPITDGVGYTGHVMDALTGQIYQQQRYMDPLLGVFTSVDPVTAYDTGDWRLFTRYAYAFNNPYTFTDPDGRVALPGFLIGVGLELVRQAVTGEIKDTSLKGVAGNVGKVLVAGAAGATGAGIASGVAKLTASAAVRATANSAAGAAIGVASTGANNAIDGKNITDGMGKGAVVGGALGATGSLAGDATDALRSVANAHYVNSIPLADRNLLELMKAATPDGGVNPSAVGAGAAVSNSVSNSGGLLESCGDQKKC